MEFSKQPWHLNTPVQATVRKDLDLENIHLHTPYATQHVLKFQGILFVLVPTAGQCLKRTCLFTLG